MHRGPFILQTNGSQTIADAFWHRPHVVGRVKDGGKMRGDEANDFRLLENNRAVQRRTAVTIAGERQPLRDHKLANRLEIAIFCRLVDSVDCRLKIVRRDFRAYFRFLQQAAIFVARCAHSTIVV